MKARGRAHHEQKYATHRREGSPRGTLASGAGRVGIYAGDAASVRLLSGQGATKRTKKNGWTPGKMTKRRSHVS